MTVLGPDGEPATSAVLEGLGQPDLGAVDEVAQQALAAARAGGRLVLRDVDGVLVDLLRLAGLLEGVGALVVEVDRLAVQVEGQAEGGEQSLGVEKG